MPLVEQKPSWNKGFCKRRSSSGIKVMTSDEMEISLDFIEWRDLSTFVRCGIDGDQVNNLKMAYEASENVPPVDLFAERMPVTSERAAETPDCDGCDALGSELPVGRIRYFIGDGWHRFHAVRELGRAVIPAVVHPGGRREALKCALGANSGFGLRRLRTTSSSAMFASSTPTPAARTRLETRCRRGSWASGSRAATFPATATFAIGTPGEVSPCPTACYAARATTPLAGLPTTFAECCRKAARREHSSSAVNTRRMTSGATNCCVTAASSCPSGS
jgi:hypothetical protein